jgi:hypothetical protein
MKKLLFMLPLLLWASATLAQVKPRPIVKPPKWATGKQVVAPQGKNFIYAHGVGTGNNVEEAKDRAAGDAYVAAVKFLEGTKVESQQMTDIRKNGLEATIGGTQMRNRRICSTPPIFFNPRNPLECRVYVLLQVERNVHGTDDFDDLKLPNCKDKDFDRSLEKLNKWHEDKEKEEKEKQKQKEKEEIEKQKRQEKLDQKNAKRFWKNGYDSYLSFGVGNGFTTGAMAGGYFMGRHGGLIGFGYEAAANVGLDKNMSADNREMSYSVGLKFYPYKCLYVGVYGTVLDQKKPFFNNNYGKFGLAGSTTSRTVSYLIGYDFCFGRGVGGVFSIAGGAINPAWEEWRTGLETWNLAWHIGFGLIF